MDEPALGEGQARGRRRPAVKRKACTVAGGTTSAHGPALEPDILVEPIGDFARREHEDLAQAMMDVAADFPIVALRTRGDLLDMDEVVVMRGRRLAIEGKCRRSARQLVARSRHDPSF